VRVMNGMRHPAHVHFFENTIWEPEKKGYQVKVTARGREPPPGLRPSGRALGRGFESGSERIQNARMCLEKWVS
jgi:hypothetical protein